MPCHRLSLDGGQLGEVVACIPLVPIVAIRVLDWGWHLDLLLRWGLEILLLVLEVVGRWLVEWLLDLTWVILVAGEVLVWVRMGLVGLSMRVGLPPLATCWGSVGPPVYMTH